MKLSLFALASFSVLSFGTAAAADQEEGILSSTTLNEDIPTYSSGGFSYSFDVDASYEDDPELLATLETAFLMAANEVHDTSKVEFNTLKTYEAYHEDIEEGHKDALDDAAGGLMHSSIGTGNVTGTGSSGGVIDVNDPEEGEAVDLKNGRELRRGWIPSKVRRNKDGSKSHIEWFLQYRSIYKGHYHTRCKFCKPDDDDDAMMMEEDFAAGSEVAFYNEPNFYQLEQGRRLRIMMQRLFCRNLRRIKVLKNPTRCWISVKIPEPDSGLAATTTEVVANQPAN